MNIDGVVFFEDDPTGDDFLSTQVHGCDVFKSLQNMITLGGDYSSVKLFLDVADDNVISSIIEDAHVDVIKTIEGNELYQQLSERNATEQIIMTLLSCGHDQWVTHNYRHWSEDE